MSEVFIVSAARTAIGRFGGSLRTVPAKDLAALVIKEALARAKVSPEQVDEVIMGEVRQTTEGSNVARVAALMAGIPVEVPAYTVNRLCASGMQAVKCGAEQIRLGEARIVVAGGTENMSRAPLYLRNARYGEGNPYIVDSNIEGGPGAQPMEIYGEGLSMGMTAENVAERYGINREAQDEFAYASQMKARKAIEEGRFKEEIVPVEVKDRKGSTVFEVDEHARETTLEKLAALPPVFKKGGTVTAGNACGRNDAAAALVLMSGEALREMGARPLARIVTQVAVGVPPEIMGIGPVPATRTALKKAGLSLEDIGLIELNEAFAAQVVACVRELGLDSSIVNVNGGAIALGHPLGCTGARLITTLLYEMRRRSVRYGLATLCVGGGQGMATIIENTG